MKWKPDRLLYEALAPTILIAAVLAPAVLLSSCGAADNAVAHLTSYNRICVGGVSYLEFPTGASVEYLPDGHIKTCGVGE